jgi:hypothetical protein
VRVKRQNAIEAWVLRELEEPGTVRCGRCDFEWTGPMSQGIKEAQAHRRAVHPDLPGKTPKPKCPPRDPTSDEQAVVEKPGAVNELRERVLELLKAEGKPMTAAEVAARIDGASKNTVANSLAWARRQGAPLHRVGAAWAHGDVLKPT